jgi:hypothetical protein
MKFSPPLVPSSSQKTNSPASLRCTTTHSNQPSTPTSFHIPSSPILIPNATFTLPNKSRSSPGGLMPTFIPTVLRGFWYLYERGFVRQFPSTGAARRMSQAKQSRRICHLLWGPATVMKLHGVLKVFFCYWPSFVVDTQGGRACETETVTASGDVRRGILLGLRTIRYYRRTKKQS